MIFTMALLVACVCLVGNARAGESPDAYELNDSVGTARAMTAGTYSCNFDKFSDIDYYNVTVPLGDEISVRIVSSGNVVATIFGQGDILLTQSSNATQVSVSHVATFAGNHTILVDGAGIYTMTITVGSTTPAAPGYEMTLVAAVSLVAIVAVYASARSKLRARV